MKVRGAKLTAWIGASGMREHRPVAVDFIVKDGSFRPVSLPVEVLTSLVHHRVIVPANPRKLHKPSVLKEALKAVDVDITRGLSEEYPYPSVASGERELRVGSRVVLYTTISDRQHHLLKGLVTKIETVVFL